MNPSLAAIMQYDSSEEEIQGNEVEANAEPEAPGTRAPESAEERRRLQNAEPEAPGTRAPESAAERNERRRLNFLQDQEEADRLYKIAYGDDFFELSTRQLIDQYDETTKKIHKLDEKRKECFLLGLRSNSVVRCPLCKIVFQHLGHHLEEMHPVFFHKCPFCDMVFSAPNCKPRAIDVDVHIQYSHPNEIRGGLRQVPPPPPRVSGVVAVAGTQVPPSPPREAFSGTVAATEVPPSPPRVSGVVAGRKDIYTLIQLVRQNPGLYNCRRPLKKVWKSGWTQIAAQLGNKYTVEECSRKWRNLRDTYYKYYKSKRLSKWRYAKDLEFLSSVYQTKLKSQMLGNHNHPDITLVNDEAETFIITAYEESVNDSVQELTTHHDDDIVEHIYEEANIPTTNDCETIIILDPKDFALMQ